MIHLVAVRAELIQLGDPVGALTINATLLYLARYIRGADNPTNKPKSAKPDIMWATNRRAQMPPTDVSRIG